MQLTILINYNPPNKYPFNPPPPPDERVSSESSPTKYPK
jgi:hypothetical protein